jgi:hypothetical protein
VPRVWSALRQPRQRWLRHQPCRVHACARQRQLPWAAWAACSVQCGRTGCGWGRRAGGGPAQVRRCGIVDTCCAGAESRRAARLCARMCCGITEVCALWDVRSNACCGACVVQCIRGGMSFARRHGLLGVTGGALRPRCWHCCVIQAD